MCGYRLGTTAKLTAVGLAKALCRPFHFYNAHISKLTHAYHRAQESAREEGLLSALRGGGYFIHFRHTATNGARSGSTV